MAIRMMTAACLATLALLGTAVMAADEPTGRITGVGGIFFKAKEPKVLAAWYRDVLGIKLEAWGGAALRYDAPRHPPALIWGTFPESTKYFAPSAASFMINYAVDDMDAFLARLKEKGVEPIKRTDDATGRFAWIVDPENNKIELWEPKEPKAAP
ncbi:VOC family protein [Chitinimonas sp.]|uniref:VOC family protein n=1 Tax=Chitinimonas sp. TaxID=1934313 RepID=UPI002F959357